MSGTSTRFSTSRTGDAHSLLPPERGPREGHHRTNSTAWRKSDYAGAGGQVVLTFVSETDAGDELCETEGRLVLHDLDPIGTGPGDVRALYLAGAPTPVERTGR